MGIFFSHLSQMSPLLCFLIEHFRIMLSIFCLILKWSNVNITNYFVQSWLMGQRHDLPFFYTLDLIHFRFSLFEGCLLHMTRIALCSLHHVMLFNYEPKINNYTG